MSRSQFYSIKLFILRHAWLNLWDKHMTTGRINQVTLLSTAKNLPRPWGTKQTPYCSTHMQPKLQGVNCWLKSIVRSHRNASWLLNSFNLSPARSTQKLTAQLSNGGTASELPDDNAWCKSQQQSRAQACASGTVGAIIAHSFGFNVYLSSKHTNCNYLRARQTQGLHALQVWTPKIVPVIMLCGALTLSTRTTFLDSVFVARQKHPEASWLLIGDPELPTGKREASEASDCRSGD